MRGSFEAKKHAYRQTQDGIVISLVLHPDDVTPELAAAPLGTILMMRYSDEIEDTSGPLPAAAGTPQPQTDAPSPEVPPQAPAQGSGHAGAASIVQRCAIRCGELAFQEWLRKTLGHPPWLTGQDRAAFAADWVRSWCKITSRRELATDPRAQHRWDRLEDSYLRATGRRTQPPPGHERQEDGV